MSAVWVVRDNDGELDAAFTKEFRAVAYMGQHYDNGVTVTRETLLTPAHAAVIKAAKAWHDHRTVANEHDMIDAVATSIIADNLHTAVATLRELEEEL